MLLSRDYKFQNFPTYSGTIYQRFSKHAIGLNSSKIQGIILCLPENCKTYNMNECLEQYEYLKPLSTRGHWCPGTSILEFQFSSNLFKVFHISNY